TPGLFALIAGTLAANGVNILSAQIETRADSVAVDTFHVNDPGGDAILDESRWEGGTRDLRRALAGGGSGDALLQARRPPRTRAAAAPRVGAALDPRAGGRDGGQHAFRHPPRRGGEGAGPARPPLPRHARPGRRGAGHRDSEDRHRS